MKVIYFTQLINGAVEPLGAELHRIDPKLYHKF